MKMCRIFFLPFFLLLAITANAERVEGEIYIGNDTIDCLIRVRVDPIFDDPIIEYQQRELIYFDENGNKHKAKPADIDGYRFKYASQEYIMKSVILDLPSQREKKKKQTLFLKQLVDGNLKLYNIYYSNLVFSGFVNENYILQDSGGECSAVTNINFKRSMMKYFSDCPQLSNKIKKEEYIYTDIIGVVKYYNTNCH